MNLNTHYKILLGLDDAWEVADVKLSPEKNKVVLSLARKRGLEVACPKCQGSCKIADHSPEREWRHLDTMQFQTILKAKTPRSNCSKCGILTTAIPWSYKNSRFTLLFESFSIIVIQACSDIKSAAKLLSIDWTSANAIMKRAVERGLERRKAEDIAYIGIDEKSYQRRHSYVTIVNDIKNGRVLEVSEGRDAAAVDKAFNTLPESTRAGVKACAMDMWAAYMTGAKKHLPNAKIIHDKFHVAKYLNDAVNKVRKAEHKELLAAGDSSLTGARQLFLFNPENLTEEKYLDLKKLTESDLKVSRAWAIKENFRWFWEYKYKGSALKFYKKWYGWATRSKLDPIIKVAKTINNHLEGLLSYFNHRITNAVAEGLNSKIQVIKATARGFRSFASYRIRILFFCGKLDMEIHGPTH